MASTDTTPPGHLSATAVRRHVAAQLRAKARARTRKTLTSWSVVAAVGIVAGLLAWVIAR